MTRTGKRRGNRLSVLKGAIYAIPLLALALPAAAQSHGKIRSDDLALATREELQLFWEEKDLIVESATRTDKPLSQTAENMIVITAGEIEKMNAHTVDEVLSRVPGLFVDFGIPDFVTHSGLHIQGSKPTHVAVKIDGVPLNLLSGEVSMSFMVPLQIIERIEIVKGAASSAWGSALGGVINIITKDTGDTLLPHGSLYGSIGEAKSLDYGGELSGKAGPVEYYLHAGRQESQGLRVVHLLKNSLFGKLTVSPTSDLTLTVSSGYMDPAETYAPPKAIRFGQQLEGHFDASTFFVNGEAAYRFTDDLSLHVNLHSVRIKDDTFSILRPSGDLYNGLNDVDKTIGGGIRLTYSSGMHNAVLGGEGSYGDVEATTKFGPILSTALSLPASSTVYPDITRWALYANDTVTLGPVSVTPGIRYDHNNIAGGFVSPSLGIAWQLADRTVARASVARGFTTPVLTNMQGGGPMLKPNPDLKPEQVWSFQAGIESGVCDYLNLSAVLFRHDMKDELTQTALSPVMFYTVNNGNVTRQGYELGAETVPFYDLSLKAAFSYVRISPDSAAPGQDNYLTQLRFRYDDRKSLNVDLYGQQTWWNLDASQGAKYNNFIWDLTATKRFQLTDTTSAELFGTVHNLFSGSSYTYSLFPNPQRWVEGGLRFKF
ncbi:vitamin B12 transporter BtuB [Geobacter sp. OR-1]|uniref:TonB-dependent receptor plug domain-containing protein n=1 Tax=Geobacter sp. OR-1 TaxID=1266765 RepID=UPI0005444470|nr:TonB-dependent receptor [Geobacter sp. OR-1]GAM08672.1 vitamin B12 transporter BtuB [Geobacter sp. OR-1]